MKCTIKPNRITCGPPELAAVGRWLYMFAEAQWGVSELWNQAALDRGLVYIYGIYGIYGILINCS